MDPRTIPFVKEEIIRNTIKSHASLLLTGWRKIGKSVSAIKAAMSIADTYYFNPLEIIPVEDIKERSATADLVSFVSGIELSDENFTVLVVDNYEKLLPEDAEIMRSLLTEKRSSLRLILISGAFDIITPIMKDIEAVVRIKQDTAELIYTLKN
ncbi:MAG: hypothetical protein RBT37_01415 [Dissulfurispiraceae bacterium]|jgi:hypothetical protein|nr:hypothetical protein [Dissulfurispiraceae bacterium]